MPDPTQLTGLILAGGKATRLNGKDKGLETYQERPLIAWAIAFLKPKVQNLFISANRNLAEYQNYELPVLVDSRPNFPGPLAGIETALQHTTTPWLVCMPCDTPHLPDNFLPRLWQACHSKQVPAAYAQTTDHAHPLCCLLSAQLGIQLSQYLDSGERRVLPWLAQIGATPVDFSEVPEAFFNMNTPEAFETPRAS